ncbi:microtubule-associated protein 9 isoform X2 [Petaurus breviceps papuanus]|uniref:microtubule-associated protein 9 isoform X2 n=1 Tax=Petaurus breviceps papuanus TaxID=3040969 RepID=UPI0036DD1604
MIPSLPGPATVTSLPTSTPFPWQRPGVRKTWWAGVWGKWDELEAGGCAFTSSARAPLLEQLASSRPLSRLHTAGRTQSSLGLKIKASVVQGRGERRRPSSVPHTTLGLTHPPLPDFSQTWEPPREWDELQKAVSARTARQQSEDYSDDFDSDDVGSLGGFSDTPVDENSTNKNLTNDFHVSDDEEKDSPKMTFLKTKIINSNVTKDLATFLVKTEKEGPDTLEEFGINSSKPQGKDWEIEQEEMKTKSTPRLVKFVSSENISNLEKDTNVKLPLPWLRGILRKTSHVGDKDVLEEEDNPAFAKLQFSHSAPSSLMRLSGKMLEIEQRTLSESPNSEGPWLTSPRTSLAIPHQLSDAENLGDHFFPQPTERSSKKDQEKTVDENHNIMVSEITKSEDSNNKCSTAEELMVSNTLEETEESQKTIEELGKNMKKSQVVVDEDRKSITSDTSPKNKNEDTNMKKTSKRNKSSRKKPLPTTTSSQYLGTLKILDQKPLQKQSLELDKADSIRAAVYQDWLVKKNLCFQELQRVKKNEAENLRIQNEQKGAKKEEASASFEAWKAMKEKEAKKMAAKKKLEEKKMRQIEQEHAEKKGEAQKAFEKWKEKKLEYLKEKNKKEREYERAKKKKEEEYYAEKIKDNLSAVEKWHEQKEFLIRQKMKEKINERKKQEIKRVEKEDKDKLAVNEYERWLEKKDKKQKHEKKQKKHLVLYASESFPQWSSPGKLAPAKN